MQGLGFACAPAKILALDVAGNMAGGLIEPADYGSSRVQSRNFSSKNRESRLHHIFGHRAIATERTKRRGIDQIDMTLHQFGKGILLATTIRTDQIPIVHCREYI